MSHGGEREATPVVLALEGFGGVYSANNSALHFKVWRAGELVEPEDGLWYLSHPDQPEISRAVTADEVRELARGKSTSVGGTTITELSRTVYDSLWRRIPADQRAPVEGDYFRQTTGPAVRINGRNHLLDTLWNRAWAPGGLREPGHSPADDTDDDDGYQPARPARRRRPAPSVATSSPQTRQHMGQTNGSRGRMGR
jgi:hypothetical protein